MQIKGECFGIEIVKEIDNENTHIKIIVEDDGNWYDYNGTFSDFWIDDLRIVLKASKEYIKLNREKKNESI